MTEPSKRAKRASNRYPLSCAQELWCGAEEAGAFGPRFVISKALRIAGRIDVAALAAALDDVVERHEMLRTIVVRDAAPRYQEVHPPCHVPLEVRDLPPRTDASRDEIAQELLTEAELGTVDVEELPLLRAVLSRFDDQDAVLTLVSHHTACDAWSFKLVVRDLAAFYAARTTGTPPSLPRAHQYREYAAWQQTHVVGAAAVDRMAYWQEQLRGAQIFTLPADRPVPKAHSLPYSAHNFVVEPEVMTAASKLARAMRSSTFVVMLAAFDVLALQIAGTTDPVVNTLIHGRSQSLFKATVGPFIDFLPLRTTLDDGASFREIVDRTKRTCLEAYAHQVPIHLVEQQIPALWKPLEDPMMVDFIFGFFQSPFDEGASLRIADGSYEISKSENVSAQIPGGAAWTMGVLSTGALRGSIQYNPEELDEASIAEWAAGYARVLATAATQPDRPWKSLVP